MRVQILRITHDADDLVRRLLAVERDVLAERIPILEVIPRHRLVHDGHARAACVVEREVAAADQGGAHRFEVPRSDPVQREIAAFFRPLREPFHARETGGARPGNRRRSAERGRAHAGNRGKTAEKLLVQSGQLRAVVAGAPRIEPDEQDGVTLESEVVEVSQAREAAGEQPSGAQEHERQRHLRHNETLTDPPPGPRFTAPHVQGRRRRR